MKTKLLIALLGLLCFIAPLHASKSFEVTVTGSGSPIVFIPGLACDGSVWDATVARYASKYECHVLTLAGFGDSGLPPVNDAPFLETVEAQLIEYLQKEKLQDTVVVGHSLGGFVALQAAAVKPELFAQLLIVDSLPFLPAATNPNATVESIKPMAASQRDAMSNSPQNPESARRMLQMMITAPDHIERAIEMTTQSQPKAVADAMYELNTTDARETVSKIRTPTLVLGAWVAYEQFGATKESTASLFDSQYAKHPNYRLKMSDRGRHFIMWDDPGFFYDQLDQVLSY